MANPNPIVRDPLPFFITAPGESDVLFSVVVAILILIVFMAGVLYLRIHAIPDKIAHGSSKVQLQLVSVLCLISLFTHNHFFWIAGLLLAFVELPDISSPIKSIARSLKKISLWESTPQMASVSQTTAPPPSAPREDNSQKPDMPEEKSANQVIPDQPERKE